MAERARGIVGKVYGSRPLLPDDEVIGFMRGERPSQPAGATAAEEAPEHQPPMLALSPREAELVTLLAEGLSEVEIAERLFVSQQTVRRVVADLAARAGEARRVQRDD